MSGMKEIRISLAIPTRSRAVWLRHALASALTAADRAGCEVEIVVSDNASDDDTPEVLAGFASPRLRVLRQTERLSMRRNFEAALDACTGSHVVFIGDDDAVVPEGFARLHEMIRSTSAAGEECEIFKWRVLNYLWPDPARGQPGQIVLRPNKLSGLVRRDDPAAVLRQMLSGRFRTYQQGGLIYHGCIARSLIERARAAAGGTYFWTSTPDVYASMVNLSLARGRILSADIPVTMGGTSPRSNGAASVDYARSGKLGAGSELSRFVTENEGDPHLGRLPPACASLELYTLDALQTALRIAPISAAPERDAWLARIAREAAGLPEAVQPEILAQSRLLLGPDVTLPAVARRKPAAPRQDPPDSLSAVAAQGETVGQVRRKISSVQISGGAAMERVDLAAGLVDRITGNDTPFAALPRGLIGALCRVLALRRRLRSQTLIP